MEGLIFDVHRLSTDDGPGLRTTFFLKGCALHCVWCHNPESLSPRPTVWWSARKCIGARDCLDACPAHALLGAPESINVDPHLCTGCGTCVETCPAGAMERLGVRWNPTELVREALKEKRFFLHSGGGVTLSGGEPSLQPAFVTEVFRLLQAEGIHTALDTCGMSPPPHLRAILDHTDLVLFDLKTFDPALHYAGTGATNERILENLLVVRDHRDPQGRSPALWIRTPLIPGYTATVENIAAIGSFLNRELGPRVEAWDLCAFNNTCSQKYVRLGIEWPLRDEPLLDRNLSAHLLDTARAALPVCPRIHLRGLA